jgi:predicted lipid-binding transport protein (Tim44 family)
MPRLLEAFVLNAKDIFADGLLRLLLIGVILAAFVSLFIFGDAQIALGVLAIGGVTAFIESKEFRNRRKRALQESNSPMNNPEQP